MIINTRSKAYLLITIASVLGISLAIPAFVGYSAPTANPTASDLPGFLDDSNQMQEKTGELTINDGAISNNAFIAKTGNVCIGTSCEANTSKYNLEVHDGPMQTTDGLIIPRVSNQALEDAMPKEKGNIWLRTDICVPDSSCATSTCMGSTCLDSCGNSYNGTLALTDGSGNTYDSIWINNGGYGECWQAENMYSAKYASGALAGSHRHCQTATNCQYDYAAANLLCPAGWHLPSNVEWHNLEMAYTNTPLIPASCPANRNDNWDVSPWLCHDAGTDLKIGGSSGLELPLSGRYHSLFGHQAIGLHGYFWTSTTISPILAKRYAVSGDPTHPSSAPGVSQLSYTKDWGYSARCIAN